MSDAPKRGPATGRSGSGFDPREVWKQVQANHKKLEECQGPHDFGELTKEVLVKVRKVCCAKCGGEMLTSNLFWYQQGLKHGRRR